MVRHTGENFIDVEGIAVASVPKALALLAGQALFSFQPARINRTELIAPQAHHPRGPWQIYPALQLGFHSQERQP